MHFLRVLDGNVRVKWFGEVSGDVPDSVKFQSVTSENESELEIEEPHFYVGLIVIRTTDFVPGLVLGTNTKNGNVSLLYNPTYINTTQISLHYSEEIDR